MSANAEKTVLPAWFWQVSLAAALLSGGLILSGCNMSKLRGGNFRDEFAQWGESHHRPGAPDELWGTSEQARQVERNLGVE